MKISFFEVKPEEKIYLKKTLKKHTLKFFDEPLSEENISKVKDSDVISVFIYSNVSSKIISQLTRLKLIATRSTGFDHIDLKTAKKNKVIVCNVPYYGENTVAEHTFALILSASRNVHKSYVRTIHDDFSIDGLRGFDLKDKTIGVIGTGHIGEHIIRMAKGFEMNVIAYDIYKNETLAKSMGFKYVSLATLMKTSNIITLHLPYSKKTHHLINKKNLRTVKKGAILINTARGGIVDTDALYWALQTRILAGAGLDVIEGEELISEEHELLYNPGHIKQLRELIRDHKIFKMDNVIFTPHNAFNSNEAILRILDATVDNINSKKYKVK